NALEADPPVNAAGRGVTTAGATIAYTIHYENIGNVDAHGVQIVTVLAPDLDPASLQAESGGAFVAATRPLTRLDPTLPPHTPRTRTFSAKVRAGAAPRTRVRAVATVVFPDAFPPSRTDTNLVEHVVPDPAFPLAPDLAVYACVPLGGDRWTA